MSGPSKSGRDALLRLEGVGKQVGELEILRDVNLEVGQGEVVVVVGPSGSGKSTLLKVANLLERPTSGRVIFEGHDLTDARCDLDAVRRRMGIVFQSYNLFPHMTARANVALGLRLVGGCSRAEAQERAVEELGRVGLAARCDSHPGNLSGGEQQRVAIARALSLRPSMMLFDEVTAALDPELVGEVLATMRELAEGGMTMLVVTHEIEFGMEIADRFVVMDGGAILEEGSAEQVIRSPRTERAREFFRHLRLGSQLAVGGEL